jgi:hypothetical protein
MGKTSAHSKVGLLLIPLFISSVLLNYLLFEYLRTADIWAEELLNMFFGGGFPSSNVYYYRGNKFGARPGATAADMAMVTGGCFGRRITIKT